MLANKAGADQHARLCSLLSALLSGNALSIMALVFVVLSLQVLLFFHENILHKDKIKTAQ